MSQSRQSDARAVDGRTAVFSACRQWRYSLKRTWARPVERVMVVIGLNPSTADETEDDPTIRRCVAFAKREGCDQLVMVNLWPIRSTDPARLWSAVMACDIPEDVLLFNRAHVEAQAARAEVVLAAWGAFSKCPARYLPDAMRHAQDLTQGLRLHCLGTTNAGHPRHPLYRRRDEPLRRWVSLVAE